jgi:hypothetical protein
MAAPASLGRVFDGAFDDEGTPILDDPLDGLALLQFQGLGQRGGADEVELASLVGTLDELDFGEVSHKAMIILAI